MQINISKTFPLWIPMLVVGVLFSVGCTRKQENGSQVIVRLPSASETQGSTLASSNKRDHFAKIAKLEAMSAADWGIAHPASLTETKCFAVVVELPVSSTTTLSTKQCTVDSAPEKNITIGQFAGLAPAGSEIELNIAPGPDRKFHLFAFAAESSGECQITTAGSLIRKSSLSGPLHIGSAKANIVSGINNIEIIGSYVNSTAYDNCEWQTPPPLTGGTLAIDAGALYTKNLAVTLTPSLPFIASEAYYTNDSSCTSGGAWEPYLPAKPGFILNAGDGPKSVYARFRDSSGSVSECLSTAIILDQTAPSISLAAVLDVNASSVSTFEFSGACSEDGLAINWSVGTVNGSTACALGAYAVSAIDLTALPDGPAAVTVSTTDAAGNIGTQSDAFIKDVIAPTVMVTSPMNGGYVNIANAPNLNIMGTCSENGATVSLFAGAIVSSATCIGGTFSGSIDVTSEIDGVFNIPVTAELTDSVGNFASHTNTLSKDTTPPMATLSGLPNGIVMDSTYTMTVNPGDVAQYRYFVSTVSEADCNNLGNYTATFPVATPLTVSTPTPALYYVCVLGIDAAGNEQFVASPTVERLTKGPVTISFMERWSSAPESIGSRILDLSISPKLANPIVLDVEVQGTALNGTHYSGFPNFRQTYAIPALNSTFPLMVSVIGTSVLNVEKRLSVSLKGTTTTPGVQIGATQTHQLWIEDGAIAPTAFAQVAVGEVHACGINMNGELFCWGSDSGGALGDGGADVNQPLAVPIDPGFQYTQVAVAAYSACGLRADSTLLCWGSNSNGQLGQGDLTSRSVPTVVGTGYQKVAMNERSVCAIKSDGTLHCWGNQADGRLGNGQVSGNATLPEVIPIGGPASDVSLGFNHACAVRTDGELLCWGANAYGQIGNNTTTPSSIAIPISIGANAVQVSAGQYYTCALRVDNKAYCWGDGASGKLGNGSGVQSLVPVPSQGTYNFSSIKTSWHTTCAVDMADNRMKCWGYGYYGLLGTGTRLTGSLTPVTVDLPGPTSNYSMFKTNICAVSDGKGFCWGSGRNSIHGNGYFDTIVWSEMTPPMDFTSLSLGRGGCGITGTGALWCWGANDIDSAGTTGQVGDGTTHSRSAMVHVDPGVNYLSVSFGTRHTCGITAANDLKCWGYGFDGQLGIGSTASKHSPVIVGSGYSAVSVGLLSTCAITTTNKLFCWGDNAFGQLGQGNTIDSTTPLAVMPGSDFLSVSVGANTACAITTAQELYCWGYNAFGQVGDGTTNNAETPLLIFSSVAQVSAGADATCLVTLANDLHCWGRNASAEVGQGTTSPPNYSTPMPVGAGYVEVKVGKSKKSSAPGAHVCGITTSGSLNCWGSSAHGQNAPAVSPVLTPTAVDGGTYTVVETGELQTCARVLAGGMWRCRGSAAESQLPTGFTSFIPQMIPRVRY